MLRKIISGGQTGADQGALYAARTLELETGGFMPLGFHTEDGNRPDLAKFFALVEHQSARYPAWTQNNILSSDATLVFGNLKSYGSNLTLELCERYKKPCYIQQWPYPKDELPPDTYLPRWLEENNVNVLNVASNRESTNRGIRQAIFDYLTKSLRQCVKHPVGELK